MEKRPNYTLMPSLEQLALRKIAVALYNEPRILDSFVMCENIQARYNSNMWEETYHSHGDVSNIQWRKAVEDKMLKLQLPKFAYQQMKPILKAVAIELLVWKSIHEKYTEEPIIDRPGCLQKLCWTSVGTLDHRKTAEEIVRCNVVNISERFKLACFYCLEDYIPVLWRELPENEKMTFCNARVETPHLQLFLPYIFRTHNEVCENPPMTASNLFEKAAFCGNKPLAEYFYQNLAQEDREISLVRSAKYLILTRANRSNFDFRKDKLTDLICYLLSLMSLEGQLEILKELPCKVLRCLLVWPWQDLFLDMAKIVFTFLPESQYRDLDSAIYESLIYSGYYFPDIFQNILLFSPIEYRRVIVEEEIKFGLYFEEFFKNEDMETVKVFFGMGDSAARLRLVSTKNSFNLIVKWSHKWHLVEQYLRAARLSEDGKKRLTDSFIEFVRNRETVHEVSIDLLREKYRGFFEFMDRSDASAENKRSLEDETSTKAKKLCCEDKKIRMSK